jgi:hypothetical protein
MTWVPMLVALLAVAPETAKEGPPRARVAVLDLQCADEADRKAVEGLSALLASEVARRPALVVSSGADLRALLGFERQKQLVGCSGGACVTELAGALGVGYLVSSEVSRVGSSWLLSLALLDARRAASVSRLTRKASSIDELVDEAPRAIDELLAALGPDGVAPPTTRFDGAWEVTIDCPATPGGTGVKGYAYRFPATIRDGRLVADHLAEDAPGSLHLEGTLARDGHAQLAARGRTGPSEYNLKQAPAGTRYAYGVSARFDAAGGTGRRVEGRTCEFTFVRR